MIACHTIQRCRCTPINQRLRNIVVSVCHVESFKDYTASFRNTQNVAFSCSAGGDTPSPIDHVLPLSSQWNISLALQIYRFLFRDAQDLKACPLITEPVLSPTILVRFRSFHFLSEDVDTVSHRQRIFIAVYYDGKYPHRQMFPQ